MVTKTKSAKINHKIAKIRYGAARRGIGWYVSEYKLYNTCMEPETFKCSLTGWELTEDQGYLNTMSLDRIDSYKDYTDKNVQLVASAVNLAKHQLSTADFIEMCKDVVSHAGYKVIKP